MGAALVTLLLALASLLGLSAQSAAAAEVDIIVADSIKIEKSSGDSTTPITQWENVKITYGFDTTGKTVAPGDTFALKLPSVFNPTQLSWPVYHTDGTHILDCATTDATGATITCTFTDDILNADGSNKYDFLTGEIWATAQVVAKTDTGSVTFGTTVGDVDVPLPGGAVQPAAPGQPSDIVKWGWFTNASRNEIVWQIFIPGDKVALDNPILVVDEMGSGQTLSTTRPMTLRVLTDRANDTWQDVPGAITLVPDSAVPGKFEVHIDQTKLNANDLYVLRYYTDTVAPTIGQTYTNKATVNGVAREQQVTRFENGGGKVDGPGFGGFGVLKQAIAGEAADLVPADMTFDVIASYTLNGQPVETTIAVTPNGEAGELRGLPVGTVVTLTEPQLPMIDGVLWGTPEFSAPVDPDNLVEISGDGKSATVTIGDQKFVYLQLVNTADKVPVPSIKIVKKDVDGNDADTTDEAVDLTAKQGEVGLDFTITNDGTEPLVNVVVSDAVTAGDATVTGLTCDFSALGGPATGTTWDGPFAPGDSFPCTANLAGVKAGVAHTDLATVVGVGQYSQVEVSDDNPYNAFVTPEQTPPPTTPETTPTTTTPVPPASAPPAPPAAGGTPPLASTGADNYGIVAGMAALLTAAGLLTLALNRRQQA